MRLRHCSANYYEIKDGYELYSYSTKVLEIDTVNKVITLYPACHCSITTMEHVLKFLYDITGFYFYKSDRVIGKTVNGYTFKGGIL